MDEKLANGVFLYEISSRRIETEVDIVAIVIALCIISTVIIVGMSVRANRLLKKNPWRQVVCGEDNARMKQRTIRQDL